MGNFRDLIEIGDRRIGAGEEAFVIAEIGHNHMGRPEICAEMIRQAKACGCDAVKLQKRENKTLFTKALYNAPYDNPASYGATYGEHREALEFGHFDYANLFKLAREIGIVFFATPFDIPSLAFLTRFDPPCYKTASGDLTNIPLLREVAKEKKPMFVSTGGSCLLDIMRALDAVLKYNDQVILMHCTAAYPCDFNELNLRLIPSLREKFELPVGLSAHDNGIAMSVVAYTLGAVAIEKHFTLNRANRGTDHAFSLEPQGMKKMVRDLRRTRLAMGDGLKRIYDSEKKPILKMAKSLYAARDMSEGTILRAIDIELKSPGGYLPPYKIDQVIGKMLARPLAEEEPITMEALK